MKVRRKEVRCDNLKSLRCQCCANQEAGPEVFVSGNMC